MSEYREQPYSDDAVRALIEPLTPEQQAFRDARPNVLGSLDDTAALNAAGL